MPRSTTHRAIKVGDMVRPRYRYGNKAPEVLTVLWVSKCGELIRTEGRGGYSTPASEADLYEVVQ